ncbi:pyruvate kinase [Pasteurella oralis]|uniref:pyruvate kinase n=1 Tax=Pasteurella oralis TaxID=1071947 RepID=UPI000C7C487E|nr:pyruvate kinase [Pasteurella oralis]
MKAFDLEKALAGEPVVLRDGSKAFVKFEVPKELRANNFADIVGFRISGYEDIVGMWEEPRPTVTLTLPCPLLKPQKDMWFISAFNKIVRSDYGYNPDTTELSYNLEETFYFATQEDAHAWLDAMKNARR